MVRYIIGKFDVGIKPGGLQSGGPEVGYARQLEASKHAMAEFPEWFAWERTASMGRLAGWRARFKQQAFRGVTTPVVVDGESASSIVERQM